MSIIFWDIPSTIGPWSPNTWKVRYCLNFKGIPYTTEWIEYPDIAAHCQKHGMPHTSIKRDGTLYYTLPAIYDPSTKLHIVDSANIMEYLEKQYPGTPSVVPHNTIGLAINFEADSFYPKLGALWDFIRPPIHGILNAASQGFYRTTREKLFGKRLEDVAPELETEEGKEQWAKAEAGFEKLAVLYSKLADKGPFLMGERVSWPDFVVGAHLMWCKKAWGEDDEKWKAIMAWQGGIWKRLTEALKAYENIVD